MPLAIFSPVRAFPYRYRNYEFKPRDVNLWRWWIGPRSLARPCRANWRTDIHSPLDSMQTDAPYIRLSLAFLASGARTHCMTPVRRVLLAIAVDVYVVTSLVSAIYCSFPRNLLPCLNVAVDNEELRLQQKFLETLSRFPGRFKFVNSFFCFGLLVSIIFD